MAEVAGSRIHMDLHHHWSAFWNQLAFSRRQLLRWQRGPYQEPPEPKDDLFKDYPTKVCWEDREQRLLQQYCLEDLKQRASRFRYLETLTFLDTLEHMLEACLLPDKTRWLDVGAKNWSYVEALYRTLEHRTRDFELLGIELDGYRVYADLHSRIDYARAFIQPLPQARYEVGDVLAHQGQYEVVSCFLPFVFEEPFLAWGLPRRYFQPKAFLEHLLALLQPEGYLLITNQGEEEAQAQETLLQQADPTGQCLQVCPLGQLPASFWPYEIPRFGWRVQRQVSFK